MSPRPFVQPSLQPVDFAILPAAADGEIGPAEARLAGVLGINLSNAPSGARYLLMRDESDRLQLTDTANPRLKPLHVDLRRRFRAQGGDPLLRALGPGVSEVIDATAGLGVDACHLAASGLRVTALESHPVIHALLEDGLRRCDDAEIQSRLTLRQANAVHWIAQLSSKVETIYLDPMYPPRPGSASSKKGMRILQDMVIHDPEGDRELLNAALSRVTRRVVVKRPRHAEPIRPGKSGDTRGKLVRFDIYPPAR